MAFQPIRPANETMIGMDERIESKILGRAIGRMPWARAGLHMGTTRSVGKAMTSRPSAPVAPYWMSISQLLGHEDWRRRRPEHHVQLGMSRDELRQARQQPLGGEARCRVHRKPVALAAAGEVHRRRLDAAKRSRDLPVKRSPLSVGKTERPIRLKS